MRGLRPPRPRARPRRRFSLYLCGCDASTGARDLVSPFPTATAAFGPRGTSWGRKNFLFALGAIGSTVIIRTAVGGKGFAGAVGELCVTSAIFRQRNQLETYHFYEPISQHRSVADGIDLCIRECLAEEFRRRSEARASRPQTHPAGKLVKLDSGHNNVPPSVLDWRPRAARRLRFGASFILVQRFSVFGFGRV